MNKKGVSMISLVVIIIVTLILVGIATTAGYRYITQANLVRAQALGTIIGKAANRRQNDVSAGVSQRFYDGYVFDTSIADFSKIEYLPEDDFKDTEGNAASDGIPDVVQEQGSMWYLFDAESATNIGADNSEAFLTRNITFFNSPSVTEFERQELVKVVLADYATGEGYYVRMPAQVALDAISNSIGNCANSPTGRHRFTIATCTEPSVCIYGCGTVSHEALGHSWVESTCTAAGYCSRCGITNPDDPAKGHDIITNEDVNDTELVNRLANQDSYMIPNNDDVTRAWVADANKHWHQCKRCDTRFNEDVHDRYFVSKDETSHQELCSICGWESIVSKHRIRYESVTSSTHRVWCEACLFGHPETSTVIHDDSGWLTDNAVFHYRVCEHASTNYCNELTVTTSTGTIAVIFKEPHYDNDGDYLCDVCGRLVDHTPPPDYDDEDFDSYANVISKTTSSITIETYASDNETTIAAYKVGILSGDIVIWSDPIPGPGPVQYTFDGLDDNTEYTMYVKAIDQNGNENNPHKLTATTAPFPEFIGLSGVPEGYVKGPYEIGVIPVSTTLPNISLVYKQNDGTWSEKIPIENMSSLKIPLELEQETLSFKFVDDNGNESKPPKTYTISCIDSTPPEVSISPRLGDSYSTSALYHRATVTLTDDKSGIAKKTEIRYGWSTSSGEPPAAADIKTITTANMDTVVSGEVDIITPEGLNGTYYLWIMQGIEDAAGNPTTRNYVSEMNFVIDDEPPSLINIKMLNMSPPTEVINEQLFVKPGGEVTITFTTNKVLRYSPQVTVNGVKVRSVTHNGANYTYRITIDDSFDQGYLELTISDVMSVNGRAGTKTYTNDDIVPGYGPVYFDKTPPVLEYVPKKN